MTPYTITVNELETETINGVENVVTKVVYTLSTDNFDGLQVSKKLSCVLIGTKDANGNDISSTIDVSNLTPYASLTEAQVISWIETNEAHLDTLVLGLSQTVVETPATTQPLPF